MQPRKLSLEELKQYIKDYEQRSDISDQLIAALEAGQQCRDAIAQDWMDKDPAVDEWDEIFKNK